MIVFSVPEDGALATKNKSIRRHCFHASCAGKCFLKKTIRGHNGKIVCNEALHAKIVYALKHFRVKYAEKTFLVQNVTKDSGAIVSSETLPAMVVVIQNAPI